MRGRQIAAARARTPYDRPVAASGAPSPNPNWLTGLIFPTSRIIATGATKIFSSVFGPETSSSSSSSGTDSSSGTSPFFHSTCTSIMMYIHIFHYLRGLRLTCHIAPALR